MPWNVKIRIRVVIFFIKITFQLIMNESVVVSLCDRDMDKPGETMVVPSLTRPCLLHGVT